jgi:hypothetical protein
MSNRLVKRREFIRQDRKARRQWLYLAVSSLARLGKLFGLLTIGLCSSLIVIVLNLLTKIRYPGLQLRAVVWSNAEARESKD